MRNSGEERLEMIKNIRARSESNYMAMNKKSQNIQEEIVERREEIVLKFALLQLSCCLQDLHG